MKGSRVAAPSGPPQGNLGFRLAVVSLLLGAATAISVARKHVGGTEELAGESSSAQQEPAGDTGRRAREPFGGRPACTGAGSLPHAPRCYAGSRTGERVAVKVYRYDRASRSGLVAFAAPGSRSAACERTFAVAARRLVAAPGPRRCLPSEALYSAMEYCSDQDQLMLDAHVTVVPEDFVLPRSACPAALLALGEEGAGPPNRSAESPGAADPVALGGEGQGRPVARVALVRHEVAAMEQSGQALEDAGILDGPLQDRFEGGWIEDAGHAPDLRGDTVFVVKTYSTFTPWKVQQIERYSGQLQGSGIPVVVLRDASMLQRKGQLLGDGKVRKSWMILGGGLKVPLCDVSWQAAIAEWGPEAFQGYGPGGSGSIGVGAGVHNQYEALWWKHCRPTGSEKHVWFVEDDAFFNGNVSEFVHAYSDKDADLVSSSFRIAGSGWWNFKSFNRSLSQGLRLFEDTSGVVANVSPLPQLRLPPCPDAGGADDREGLIFRQDVVERYSAQLFGMLDSALSSRLLAPAEAFMSTLCASGTGLHGKNCSMLDWAPVAQRDSGKTWASPLWCWSDGYARIFAKSAPGALGGRQCGAGWGGKWIHPVKTTQADPMACPAHAK